MSKCRVCNKELTNLAQPCPRCGFAEPAFFGDPSKAEQLIKHKADAYRTQYLCDFDFGIVTYRWKDGNGTLVLDHTERISFGSGFELVDNTYWLEQSFARIPNVENLDVEVSILFKGMDYRKLNVSVPAPQGKHLQQVGINLQPDMTLRLVMKNPENQTESTPVAFLLD